MKTFFDELLKWILRAFVFPLLTLFIIVIVVFNVIPQAEMRHYLADKIRERIHRQLEIGPLHLGLRGLSVDELKVSEIPTFGSGLFFKAKGIRLGWNLKSLWEGLNIRKQAMTKSAGSFHVDDFQNPHYLAKEFSVRWSLSEIDPTLGHLNGWAKLDQGTGLLQNIDQLMATSRSAKIALAPVLALLNLEKLGVLRLGLPDLRRWPIQDIKGNYTFKDGLMTVKEFNIESPLLGMGTRGTVDLRSGNLLLEAELHAAKSTMMGAADAKIHVAGTLSKPQVDLADLKAKAFRATVSDILKDPGAVKQNVDATIKKLFH